MQPDSFDIQGHRGARGLHPENTIPGFLAAVELGVTTLEMDVVISKDGRVVVSHDPWLARAICRRPDGRRIPLLRERSYRIFDMSYAEVAEFDCGSLRHPRFHRQQPATASKPLLSDVLELVEERVAALERPAVFYSIETKSRPEWEGIYHPDPETFARLLVDDLEAAGVSERAVAQSFDVRTLHAVKRMDRSIRLSLLVDRKGVLDLESNVARLGFRPDVYSPHHAPVTGTLVAAAHDMGLGVIPWTVNDPVRMIELRDAGVDGLITDYPDVAIRELRP